MSSKPDTFSTPSFEETPRTSGTGFVLKILGSVILLTAIGVTTSLATRLWDPLWNPFRSSPEKVIERMVKENEKIKTSRSKIQLDISLKEEAKEIYGLSFNILSDIDATDLENMNSSNQFNGKLRTEGTEFSLSGESRDIGEDFYLKITEIPLLLQFPLMIMGIDIGQIKNQWIKIDEESLKGLLGEQLPFDFEKIKEKQKEKEKEMIGKINNLLENKKLYLVKKEFPDEKIDENKVYHYLVVLNKEEIKKLISELWKLIIEYQESTLKELGSPLLSEEEKGLPTGFEEKFDEVFEKIGEINADIWIGKKDFYLYKIKAEKEIDISIFEPKEKGKVFAKLEMNLSNFNQLLKIEPPEKFKTILQILSPELRDGIRTDDLEKISKFMKEYYEKNQRYFTSETIPIMIDNFKFPNDPGEGTCVNYQWISNIGNSREFCVYACLENKEYFVCHEKTCEYWDEPPRYLTCEKPIKIPAGYPDLTIITISPERKPSSVFLDKDEIGFNIKIKNQGKEEVRSPFYIEISAEPSDEYLEGFRSSRRININIKPGESIISYHIGGYYLISNTKIFKNKITVKVDALNNIIESDENNNVKKLIIEALQPLQPF